MVGAIRIDADLREPGIRLLAADEPPQAPEGYDLPVHLLGSGPRSGGAGYHQGSPIDRRERMGA